MKIALLDSPRGGVGPPAGAFVQTSLCPAFITGVLLQGIQHSCYNDPFVTLAREHLVDQTLRTVLWCDPYVGCRLTKDDIRSSSYGVPLLRAMDWNAVCLDLDARHLQNAFQMLLETKQALVELNRRRHHRRQVRAQQLLMQRNEQKIRKVPRRTLLSNITDYEEDLGEDFFSELIEQVRLPTFTLEEYYEESEDDDDLSSVDGSEFTSVLADIQATRRRNTNWKLLASEYIANMDLPPMTHNVCDRHTFYSFKAVRRKPAMGRVDLNATQCPLDELRIVSLDLLSQHRHDRALQRLLQLHNEDPILESFEKVPFPHCNVQDLQLLALDVLHQKRRARLQKFDPCFRIHSKLLLQTPMCDLQDLLVQPLDQLLRRRQERLPVDKLSSRPDVAPPLPQNLVAASSSIPDRIVPVDSVHSLLVAADSDNRATLFSGAMTANHMETESSVAPEMVQDSGESDFCQHRHDFLSEDQMNTDLTDVGRTTFQEFGREKQTTELSEDHHDLYAERLPIRRHPADVTDNRMPNPKLNVGSESIPFEWRTDSGDKHQSNEAFPETFAPPIEARVDAQKLEGSSVESSIIVPRNSLNRYESQDSMFGLSPTDNFPSLKHDGDFLFTEDQVDGTYDGLPEKQDRHSQIDVFLDDSTHIPSKSHLVESLRAIQARLKDVTEELNHLRLPENLVEGLNDDDIAVLRQGCDWTVDMDNFGSIDDGELLWHLWRNAEESDDLHDAELRLLNEFTVNELN